MLTHRHIFKVIVLAFMVISIAAPVRAQEAGQVRLKELISIEGATPVPLTGYGLVVGLDRTGDRARGQRNTPYTVQSIANMLRRFGITVDPNMLASRNAAAVMVTTVMDPFARPGSTLDVTVSALGDARSLSGGVLLQTPLLDPTTGQVYAISQGPITTGAILASNLGSSVQVNNTNTGRVPNGAIATASIPFQIASSTELGLIVRRPDFTNAVRIADVINGTYPNAARVEHAGLIRVTVPQDPAGPSGFMAALETLRVPVDQPARVVINERTGTIVAGGNVRIAEVMVTYGGMVISTQTEPFVSQPPPFSGGQTVAGAVGTASVDQDIARSVVLPPNTDVTQLAAALNDLGMTARDVIAIFQAIDRAGALQGELIIL